MAAVFSSVIGFATMTNVGDAENQLNGVTHSSLTPEQKEKKKLAKRIIKAILSTFTETPANSERAVMSAFHQTKVLAYMCALALHLDNFSVDHDKLARNCNIPPATLRELFRTLGCTSSVVGGEKRMVLKTPFTLPQPRKGKAGGR